MRHERFVQELAKGTPQGEAYLAAGFNGLNPESRKANASRLAARPEVRARLHELLLAAARSAEVSAVDVTRMLWAHVDLALERNQLMAAIRATELLGRQIGMFRGIHEVRVNPLSEFHH